AASRSERPLLTRPARATANQATSRPPSARESSPSSPSASSGSGAAAVQAIVAAGRRPRRGASRAASPGTPSARKVVPPRNVPAAAPGSPRALAAIPAARFSSSSPETTTVIANALTPSRDADTSSPSRNASAPATTSTRPRARSASATPAGTRRSLPGAAPAGAAPLRGRHRGRPGGGAAERGGEPRPRVDLELPVDVGQVGLDGAEADEQGLRDLPVAHAPGGELGHPELGWGQRLRAADPPPPKPRPRRAQLAGGQPLEREGAEVGALVQAPPQDVARRRDPASPPQRRPVEHERPGVLDPRRRRGEDPDGLLERLEPTPVAPHEPERHERHADRPRRPVAPGALEAVCDQLLGALALAELRRRDRRPRPPGADRGVQDPRLVEHAAGLQRRLERPVGMAAGEVDPGLGLEDQGLHRGALPGRVVARPAQLRRRGVQLAALDQRPGELRPRRGQEVLPALALGGDGLLGIGDRVEQ